MHVERTVDLGSLVDLTDLVLARDEVGDDLLAGPPRRLRGTTTGRPSPDGSRVILLFAVSEETSGPSVGAAALVHLSAELAPLSVAPFRTRPWTRSRWTALWLVR